MIAYHQTMDPTKTVFADLRKTAAEVVRVQTESSVYIVAFHHERDRNYVVVRGEAGTDRENVVVRDSDPRIGDQSMFEVPISEWVGKTMDVALMRTSPIVSATLEADPTGTSYPSRAGIRIAPPPGMSDTPRMVPGLGKGTNVANPRPAPHGMAQGTGAGQPRGEVAQKVVVGQGSQVPYPQRHVMYAEDVATYLRSIHRRDRLWDDIADDGDLTARLTRALEDSQDLIRLILRRRR